MQDRTIGTMGERSLHAALKQWLALPGDEMEAEVDGFQVDILRGEHIIEVQTRSFRKAARKLRLLLNSHAVTLCYPVTYEKWISHISPEGEILRRRKSPRRGSLLDVFEELVSTPDLPGRPGFCLQALVIREEDVRCPDGGGSWRRRGVSLVDRKLLSVVQSVALRDASDFLSLLPEGIPSPFTNSQLGKVAGLSAARARRISYTLRRMGALAVSGKSGRELLYAPCIEANAPEMQLFSDTNA